MQIRNAAQKNFFNGQSKSAALKLYSINKESSASASYCKKSEQEQLDELEDLLGSITESSVSKTDSDSDDSLDITMDKVAL